MKHRFLHTLVFSSVMALEGCAGAPSTPESGPAPRAEEAGSEEAAVAGAYGSSLGSTSGSSGLASSSASSGASSSQGSSRSASLAPEPAEAVAADMRLCEVGWGTTKSGRHQVDPWDCSTVSVDGVERTECTDAAGRCVQP